MNESFWTLVLDPKVKHIHFIGREMIEITYYDGNSSGAERDFQSNNWKVFHTGARCLPV